MYTHNLIYITTNWIIILVCFPLSGQGWIKENYKETESVQFFFTRLFYPYEAETGIINKNKLYRKDHGRSPFMPTATSIAVVPNHIHHQSQAIHCWMKALKECQPSWSWAVRIEKLPAISHNSSLHRTSRRPDLSLCNLL